MVRSSALTIRHARASLEVCTSSRRTRQHMSAGQARRRRTVDPRVRRQGRTRRIAVLTSNRQRPRRTGTLTGPASGAPRPAVHGSSRAHHRDHRDAHRLRERRPLRLGHVCAGAGPSGSRRHRAPSIWPRAARPAAPGARLCRLAAAAGRTAGGRGGRAAIQQQVAGSMLATVSYAG